MPLDDRYDNALTTTAAAARDHYVTGVDHILAATHGAEDAFAASTAADPDFALGHVGAARAAMYAGDMAGAKAAIARAVALQPHVTPREAAHIDIFSTLLSGQVAQTRDRVLAHVAEYPRDVLAAQICTNIFGLIGFSGDPGREAAQLAYTAQLLPHYGEDWWLLSVHAQALCETGQVDPALAMMERSLDLNNANANAAHFKAHALYEHGAAEAGLAYLADWISGYDSRALLHGHLKWHEALWTLGMGDSAGMWAIMDGAIAPGASQSLPINVLTDSAALLYRAEIAGVPVDPARWRALSDYAAQAFPATGQSFADMHAALAHAMAGNGDRLAAYAQCSNGFAADLVRPVAVAWGAIARQDWATALASLTPIMADHARVGGSRAQRDLLEFTWVNVLLKLGRADEARRAILTRRAALATTAPIMGLHAAT